MSLLAIAHLLSAGESTGFYLITPDAGILQSLHGGSPVSQYTISCPDTFHGDLFLRVFDADLGGALDLAAPEGKARYRVIALPDSASPSLTPAEFGLLTKTLIDTTLRESIHQDMRWLTVGQLRDASKPAAENPARFLLSVEGHRGGSINAYQISLSGNGRRNEAVPGVSLSTSRLMCRQPASPVQVTEIRLHIPENVRSLDILVSDLSSESEMTFQSNFRAALPLQFSKESVSDSIRIRLLREEAGQTAALVIRNRNESDVHIGVQVVDDSGSLLPLQLPARFVPENHVPVPKFVVVPLSDCFSVMLDGSESIDPDADALNYTWFLDGQKIGQGVRLVHHFEGPGSAEAKLLVTDNSGFVANSASLTKPIKVSRPPNASFDAPDFAVPGDVVHFDASASSDEDGKIVSYQWDFGGLAQDTGAVVTYAFSKAGDYPVSLRVEDDSGSLCNSDETTAIIHINTPPMVGMTVPEKGAVNERFHMDGSRSIDSDGTIIRYVWDMGDGHTAEGRVAEHRYTTPGQYTVRLTLTDDAGVDNSTAQLEARVFINSAPEAAIQTKTVVAADEPVDFDGRESMDADGELIDYAWQFGDGSSGNGSLVQHAYTNPGTYPVSFIVRDNSGCLNDTAGTQIYVRVNAPPVAKAGDDQKIDSGTVILNAGESFDSDDDIIDYFWNFGDTQSTHGKQVNHTYALPGTYTVVLTVTDNSGTSSARRSDTLEVFVNHPPLADGGDGRLIAVGDSLLLDGRFSSDPDGELVDFIWQIGPNVQKEGKTVTHRFDKAGSVQVQLTVTDNMGARDIHTIPVTVNAAPVPVILPGRRAAPGENVLFDASASTDTDGEIVETIWDWGDGSEMDSSRSPSHIFQNPGRYTVTLTVQDNSRVSNSIAQTKRIVHINHAPVAEAGGDKLTGSFSVFFDASASYDDDMDALVYRWEFGDGDTGSGQKLSHTYDKPGVYPVSLIVDDGSRLSNAQTETRIRVHINSAPKAVITAPAQVCAGENVLFDAGNSIDEDEDLLKYKWDFGDGSTEEGINPVHMYAFGGYYRVQLTVMDDSNLPNHFSVDELTVHAIDAPVARAGSDLTVCANSPVIFDASESSGGGRPIQSFEWDFGDGNQGGGMIPTHTFLNPGLYSVRLRIAVPAIGNCENFSEDELTVTVQPSPVAAFEMPVIACPGEAVHFDASASSAAQSQITRYTWDFGDSIVADGRAITHIFEQPGRYSVRLTIETDSEQDCNTSFLEKEIQINSKPEASFVLLSDKTDSISDGIVINEIVRFDARESGDEDGFIKMYSWDFGDGNTASGVFASHRYKEPGVYQVTLRVEDNSGTECDSDTATAAVRVSLFQQPAFMAPVSGCVGETLTFSSEADSVIWSFSDGLILSGPVVERSFDIPGLYQIQNHSGPAWSEARDIRIKSAPDPELPAWVILDQGDSLRINPTVQGKTSPEMIFEWDAGDSTQSVATPVFKHLYEKAGEYEVLCRLIPSDSSSSDCPTEPDTTWVRILAAPSVSIAMSPEKPVFGGARDEVTFRAIAANPDRHWFFDWDFGDGYSASGPVVTHLFSQSGRFRIRLSVSDADRCNSRITHFDKTIEVQERNSL